MRTVVSLLLIGTLLSGCSLAGRPRPGADFTLAGLAMVGVAASAAATHQAPNCDSDCSAYGGSNWGTPVAGILLGATALVFVISGLKGLSDDRSATAAKESTDSDRNAQIATAEYQQAWQQEMARRARRVSRPRPAAPPAPAPSALPARFPSN